MFSSTLRPGAGSRRVNRRPDSTGSLSPHPTRREYTLRRHATADFTEADDDEPDDSHEEGPPPRFPNDRHVDDEGDDDDDENDNNNEAIDEDGRHGALPVLPLFSASHLGALPRSSN